MDQVSPEHAATGAPSPTNTAAPAGKAKVATVWLGGCSGCHMSILDLDERLIDLAGWIDLVFGPFVDAKEYPEGVDLVLVEGAVANEEHLHTIRRIRERTRFLVSFGDCAVTGNVTALRNPLGKAEPVLQRAYIENVTLNPRIPDEEGIVPKLLDRVIPVHEVVKVDLYVPGCPPSADLIHFVLTEILEGRHPDLSTKLKYG
jgi:NAD-reducing hydrogenase small subunit